MANAVVEQGRRVVRELEPEVNNLLRECERTIDEALDNAHDALRRIHDEKLYKAGGYKTFEDYAEKRWGYSKSRAYQLIDHSKIVEYLKSEGVEFLPGGEGMTRPLQKLRRISKSEDDFLQRAGHAWQVAQDTAPKRLDVPQVTVQHVESSMSQYGIYRNVKKSGESVELEELRDRLTKLSQCDALKTKAEAFAKKHGAKACPSKFHDLMAWLMAYAEACGGEEFDGRD